MSRLTMLTLAVAGVAAACTPKPATPPEGATLAVDQAALRPNIDSLRAKYARLQIAGDAPGVSALYSDQAGVDVYGMPRVRGRPAIDSAFKQMYAMRKYSMSDIVPTKMEFRTNNDGSEIGTYHDMWTEAGKTHHEWGRYLVAFAKGTDGVWKLDYLMAFGDSTKVDK